MIKRRSPPSDLLPSAMMTTKESESPSKGMRHRRSLSSNVLYCVAVTVVLGVVVVCLVVLLKETSSIGDTPSSYIGTRKFPRLSTTPKLLPYFTPTIRTDIPKEAWKHSSFIHIVKTRFMQEQGNLTSLGAARLALFRVFCLPTIAQQSTQHFLWIIKTDPDLHMSILSQLVDSVMHLPNVYVVASNVNFRVNEKFPGGWRDGAEGADLVRSRIYSGDQTVLEQAMALQNDFPVLETRLDADDGLHVQFLQMVQQTALKQWRKHPDLEWMYWCSRRHMEWHWMDPHANTRASFTRDFMMPESLTDMVYSYGALQGGSHSRLCITPGITTGYAVGTRESDVPVFAHDELVRKIKGVEGMSNNDNNNGVMIKGCGLEKTADCLQFIESFVFEAVRSRSPTSAGMLKIQAEVDKLHNTWWVNYAFWNMLQQSFGIHRDSLQWMNAYLADHLIDIARDNLLGQCTTGHSCKESARGELEQLIASRNMTATSTAAAE